MDVTPRGYLVSPRWDLGWFVAPGVLALAIAVALGVGEAAPAPVSPALWVLTVLLVDVAHVWASLHRTYLDRTARIHHATVLRVAPVACLWGAFLLHLHAPLTFWRAAAYLAVFHFIRQFVGFARIYARLAGDGPGDRRLAAAAVWAGTGGPILWWHGHLPREFAWFVDGDFAAGVPAWLGDVALGVSAMTVLAFVARRLHLRRDGHPAAMIVANVLLPTLSWWTGIVAFDDDRVFTLTNVVLHGVPYLALVWLTGGRARTNAAVARLGGRASPAQLALAYYGALALLAFAEEFAWDRVLWHERPMLFGGAAAGSPAWDPAVESLLVALLSLPQLVHYVLDGFIWRVGPKNPELGPALGACSAPE